MTTQNAHADVLIIGGGPGGYTAAIRSAQLGLDTVLVERAELGGVCLNWGCIPTKALLHGADTLHSITQAGRLGFTTGELSVDLPALVRYSRGVADRLSHGVAGLMRKNGVRVVTGTAALTGKGEVSVTPASAKLSAASAADQRFTADHVIVATGARPRALPGIVPDRERIWTSSEALIPTDVPEHLLIVGSGAIGSEFASLYRDLGSRVTMVELADQNLPVEDPEVSAVVRRSFERRGIEMHTGSHLEQVESTADAVTAVLVSGDGSRTEVRADRLLVAAGVQPNAEGLGLEALGCELTDRGRFIAIDEWGHTNVAGLYAIGDVAGPPCLAHKAAHEGVATVEHLAGVAGAQPVDRAWIPGATYTHPEVASLGMTEPQARAAGHEVNVGHMPFVANGRAIGIDDTEGFVKVIYDATSGELLGAHLVGPNVTELLPGFSVLRALEGTAEDLEHVVFAHPTLSETMHEATLDALGIPLNQ
ncbi:dihydrolipoyl dehydrogenase [Pseudoclavibacter sp. 13-3]|uniref:dihydrolipoyl dehydrogenase n=1 Tax=Pseudoclavibacter sp. 13-3 TaxID=2901228 RepID=UPI001E613837|nr:dihydrolipoyl dehydrogenase [Pseudoclavibacter sp. 13-3]MCD7101802.1 dihydrolipoyl dehydrogenase [Pseudoclavibacter sp. 13-3]